ncbi:hypothetical protein [Clostridioides difficile]|uniref:hypothetical protein n=1 Tax=Clostridioides difficile TaxID=1496 RepID=UPI000D1DC362|nr:hypothetical protein [Clostridioides difficile]MBF9867507.1 hypothetical protein [Clostridioides difficile]MBY1216479.1 hypothetical protein [Clostridioides difficile]MBZ1029638.1 hypothetical protein [Clostridioides difficile]MCA0852506.1 hypothetical protein [Clostridioides difficile]MCA0875286.1 hypothetical protein [Clostridioides difficile]
MEAKDLKEKTITFIKSSVDFFIYSITEWLKFLWYILRPFFLIVKYIWISTIGRMVSYIVEKTGKRQETIGFSFLMMLIILVPPILKFVIKIFERFVGNTSSEWLSFYGSYLGGILGGIATLMAVVITTNQTRIIQEENKKETRKIQEENKILQLQNNNKAFVDELASLVGEYCANISAYYYGIKENKEIRDFLKKVHDNYTNGYITEQDYNHVKIIYENEKHEVNREKSNSIYFILKIKLDNVENSASLLNLIECMHGYYCFGYSENKSLIDNKQFSNFTNKILEETSRFTNNYLKNRNYI